MRFTRKKTVIALAIISVLYFCVFFFPNSAGSDDLDMLSVFEPDEFAQYPHVMRTLEFRGATLRHKLWHIVAYQHYYYGFPFYALSTLVLLPLKLFSSLDNVQLNMLLLRQLVSVLPMVATVWVLVYLQTRFKSFWKTVALFIFLLCLPAVVRNDMWWHPDSLAILFSVLVFFFLERDRQRYGINFLLSAVAVGLSVGTKMLGWFFFMTIPTYLVWGVVTKKIRWHELIKLAALFLLIMGLTIVVSNPVLIHPEERSRIISIQKGQAKVMGFGWDVAYEKGPLSWLGIITKYYGHWFFVVISFLSLSVGIIDKEKRLKNVLILSWVLPFGLYILYLVAVKPKHLFLPVMLPLYSSLINLFPAEIEKEKNITRRYVPYVFLILLAMQFGQNMYWNIQIYTEKLHREETSSAISFYSELESEYLSCLAEQGHITIYRDIRTYLPSSVNWEVNVKWRTVDYDFIRELNPEMVVLEKQRILDYTYDGVVEDAEDRGQMQRTLDFYTDASEKNLTGYTFLVEDDFGIAFARNDVLGLLQCK
ncbi:MAG: hypothetical protein MAG431_01774 [Chloroflexi bacterium]|nr:hypothetical protein [Chloroflexota bacterium]